jgi:uncharacterized protein
MMARTTHASAVTLAVLMTLTGFPKFGAATLVSPALSQSPSASPAFLLPSSMPSDSTIQDDSGTYVAAAPADGGATATDAANQQRRQGGWLWWLLLLPLALLIWWWLKGRNSDDSTDAALGGTPMASDSVSNRASGGSHDGDNVARADLTSAEPAAPPEPSLADRVSSVISADRASINPEGTVRGGVPEEAPVMSGAALTAGLGPTATASLSGDQEQSAVEAAKFDVGQTDLSAETLADVDSGLADLPDGYGDSRIVLLPRDPQWAYVYWDVPNAHKEELRRQGGERLALRFYDVTDIDLNLQNPHTLQQFDCEEMARSWYLPVSVSDRDYVAEIGYLTRDGRWLMLARSAPARIPPVYPSDWFDDQFVTVNWDDDLRDQTVLTLAAPTQPSFPRVENPLYEEIFDLAQSTEAQRIAGSLYSSMQMVPEQSISSYVFPSGVGLWALPTSSMSGIGMSGIGFSASMPLIRPRKFWLVADAELIVYGATEPDARVTIGGRQIELNPDGTFRFQMSFQDGLIDYPIVAIAADGEQTRDIHMEFVRETPDRQTNTKDEATDEWL